MSRWYSAPETTPRFAYPNEIFVRFVARNYYSGVRSDISFLELGSGTGADLKFLEEQGFDANGIDSHPLAYANYHEDISLVKEFKEQFDCIYSLNVLCHVENPPYRDIAGALRVGGKFFAILPALETEADLEGKGFTRLYSPSLICQELEPFFSRLDIRPSCYPHRQRNHQNWVVEADK